MDAAMSLTLLVMMALIVLEGLLFIGLSKQVESLRILVSAHVSGVRRAELEAGRNLGTLVSPGASQALRSWVGRWVVLVSGSCPPCSDLMAWLETRVDHTPRDQDSPVLVAIDGSDLQEGKRQPEGLTFGELEMPGVRRVPVALRYDENLIIEEVAYGEDLYRALKGAAAPGDPNSQEKGAQPIHVELAI